jgi:hypothetical protein
MSDHTSIDGAMCDPSVFEWACDPKAADLGDTFWRDNQLPADEVAAIVSVNLPGVNPPYSGETLPATISGRGWSATITWSPADASATLGETYTATFELTATGVAFFDPNVTVNQGGTITVDTDDNKKATAVVTYPAIVNRPSPPPTPGGFKAMIGAWEVLNYDPSSVGTPRPTGVISATDFLEGRIFDLSAIDSNNRSSVALNLTTSETGLWVIASTRGAALATDEGLGFNPLPSTEAVSFTIDGVDYIGTIHPVNTGLAVSGNANWIVQWPAS